MTQKLFSFLLITAFTFIISSCTGSQSSSPSNENPVTPPTTPTNDPGITYDGTNLTIKGSISSDLTAGSFGAAIRINNGVELFFYGTGTVSGEQTFVISKSELELELGQNINASDLKVRVGYSSNFPARAIIYTGATATLKN